MPSLRILIGKRKNSAKEAGATKKSKVDVPVDATGAGTADTGGGDVSISSICVPLGATPKRIDGGYELHFRDLADLEGALYVLQHYKGMIQQRHGIDIRGVEAM